ncbi:MAG: preprotein translocase subunit SecG [Candidatus Magasanikbacteria bacterium]|nr:preprotein translocase subunit SecG [Candidatus Magasanikbacteria bacterium]
MKETILNIIQLVLAVVLIAVVLLQQKGTGLSGVFGGSGNIYSTKRGLDKILHYITIVTTTIFFIISLVRLVIQ